LIFQSPKQALVSVCATIWTQGQANSTQGQANHTQSSGV